MKFRNLVYISFFILLVVSCRKTNEETNWTWESTELKYSFLSHYRHQFEMHEHRLDSLKINVELFDQIPIITRFNIARESWKSAWQSYLELKPYKYIFENMTGVNDFDISRVESPGLNYAYLDSTAVSPNTGIIMDQVTYPIIDLNVINSLHNPGTVNSTLGYQVLEFLLWGEDNVSQVGGTRAHFEFISTSQTNIRRRTFLNLVTAQLYQEFQPYSYTSIESEIFTTESKEFIDNVLKGLIKYIDIDIIQQGLDKPLDSQDIEDEISRFSDNTKQDIHYMLKSVASLINGSDEIDAAHEFFLKDLLRKVNTDDYSDIMDALAQAKVLSQGLWDPFDTGIIDPNGRTVMIELRDQMKIISDRIKSIRSQMVL